MISMAFRPLKAHSYPCSHQDTIKPLPILPFTLPSFSFPSLPFTSIHYFLLSISFLPYLYFQHFLQYICSSIKCPISTFPKSISMLHWLLHLFFDHFTRLGQSCWMKWSWPNKIEVFIFATGTGAGKDDIPILLRLHTSTD